MPSISVIVPIYNTEKYLHRCIDSILGQTFTDFELLLINDGSTDSSGSICEEYANIDIRVHVFHKKNGGATSARNMGIDNAEGMYLMFVDSDDYIRKEALELLYKSFDDSVDVVVANINCNLIISGEEWIKLLLICKIRCEVWGTLYKRSVLDKIKFQTSIIIGEDLLLNIQYALNCNVVKLLSSNIYIYNTNNVMSLTRSYKLTLKHEEELLLCLDSILNRTEYNYAFEMFRKRYLTLERLIFIGEKPYKETWVKSLMNEKKKYKNTLGLKEIILLSIPYATFCRVVLKTGLFVKKLFE